MTRSLRLVSASEIEGTRDCVEEVRGSVEGNVKFSGAEYGDRNEADACDEDLAEASRGGSGGGREPGGIIVRHFQRPKAKLLLLYLCELVVKKTLNLLLALCPAARSFSCHVDYMYTYPRPTWHPRLNQSDSEEGN